jgi:hypothetical protein
MADPRIRIAAVDDASRVIAGVSGKLDAMGLSAGRLGSVFKTLGASVSAGVAVSLFRGINDGVDAFNDLNDATKASVENLSALEDVGDRTGTSFETVSAALVRFNQALKDARPGSEAEAAFRALGLQVEKLKQLDPAEALRQTSIALATFADDGNKARLVQELFGRSVREVAPFLKNLAENGELVAKVTTEQAAAAETFNRELLALDKNAKDAGRALVSDLVTGINAAAKAYRESGLSAGLNTLLFGSDQFQNDKKLTEQTEELLSLESSIEKLRNNPRAAEMLRLKEDRLRALREEIKLTQTYRTQLSKEAEPPAGPEKKKLPTRLNPTTAKKDSEIVQRTSELDRYTLTLLQAIDREQDLTEVQRAQRQISQSGGQGFSEAKRRYVLDLAERIDATKAAAEQEKSISDARVRNEAANALRLDALASGNDAQARQNLVLQQQIEELGLSEEALQSLRLARLDDAIAMERQNLIMAQNNDVGAIEVALIEQRIRLLQSERGLTQKSGERQLLVDGEKESADFAKTLNSDVKSALSGALRDTKRPIEAFGDAIGNVVFTRLTNASATAFADLLVGTGKPGGSGGLFGSLIGGFSKLLSFDGGGSTGPGSRSGGIDGKGGFLGVLHPNEDVVDRTKGQGAGSVVIHLNTQVGDVASMSYVQAAVQNGVRAALAAARRNEVYA